MEPVSGGAGWAASRGAGRAARLWPCPRSRLLLLILVLLVLPVPRLGRGAARRRRGPGSVCAAKQPLTLVLLPLSTGSVPAQPGPRHSAAHPAVQRSNAAPERLRYRSPAADESQSWERDDSYIKFPYSVNGASLDVNDTPRCRGRAGLLRGKDPTGFSEAGAGFCCGATMGTAFPFSEKL